MSKELYRRSLRGLAMKERGDKVILLLEGIWAIILSY